MNDSTAESITAEIETLSSKADLSVADGERLRDLNAQRTALESGIPAGRAVLDTRRAELNKQINDLRVEADKLPEHHTRRKEIFGRVALLTAERQNLTSQTATIDAAVDQKQTTAAVEAAPLALPPLEGHSGRTWDEPGLRTLRTAMHEEGAGDAFQDVAATLARIANARPAPMKDDELRATMRQRWGSTYNAKSELVSLAENLLEERSPELFAKLDADPAVSFHPEFLEMLARVGEQLLNVNHPRGYARRTALNAKKLAAAGQR